MTVLLPLLLVAAVLSSWWLTGRLRVLALERQIVDRPNERSLHTAPTPRGGGLAIVIVLLIAVPIAAGLAGLSAPLAWALVGGGAALAIIGVVDDRRHVPIPMRLGAHVAIGVWVALWLGAELPANFLDAPWLAGVPRLVALTGYVVWLMNVTNFMDGIDGLAAVEAITVCCGGALLAWVVAPAGPGSAVAGSLLVAAAVTGFLIWNWPPARIFMGDGGSCFVGLALAVLSLDAAHHSPRLFWSWLILIGVFAVDASWTRLRRATQSWRFYEPHRTHAYQHAARRAGAHLPVTRAVAAINTVWLLPLAFVAAAGGAPGGVLVAVAYAPILALAIALRAGLSERP